MRRTAPNEQDDSTNFPPRTVSESAMGSLSFFVFFVIGTDTFLVAPLLPSLQEEFGVPLVQSG